MRKTNRLEIRKQGEISLPSSPEDKLSPMAGFPGALRSEASALPSFVAVSGFVKVAVFKT